MVKFILYVVLQIIGLSMVLIPSKSYNRTEKDKQYHERRDLTVYELCIFTIGIIVFSFAFLFMMFSIPAYM